MVGNLSNREGSSLVILALRLITGERKTASPLCYTLVNVRTALNFELKGVGIIELRTVERALKLSLSN